MKKKNRRNSTKYPGLKPELNLKTRYDLLDQEYSDKLPDKKIEHCSNPKGECKVCNDPKTRFINPKAYLNQFNEEYVNDKLDRNNLKKNLHNTQALKKDCDDRNNSRNRDILTQQKASGRLVDYEKVRERDNLKVKSPEDEIIFKEEIAELKKKKS